MREYKTPIAEKLTFDYTETVVASGSSGHKYRLYTDGYFGCRETETDIWVDDLPTP
jgi:hypothetical protein